MSDTKTNAAAIRAELKAAGYNARRVSIRTSYYSMGSSVTATIRDASVDAVKVREIVERIGEHISRDASGEILGGGNTYVHIRHSKAARGELRARHEDAVQVAMDAAARGSGTSLHPVAGFSNVCVGVASNGWGHSLWIDGTRGRDFDTARTGSFEIATSPKATVCEAPEPTPDPEPGVASQSVLEPTPEAVEAIETAIKRAGAKLWDSHPNNPKNKPQPAPSIDPRHLP